MKRTHKACKDCKQLLTVSEFYASPRPNGKVYHSSYCKVCAVRRSRTVEKKVAVENFQRLWDYFDDHHPCVDCGEDNPLKLSLDHRDPARKNAAVSDIMKQKWHRVLAEIKLCDVRCHNCHAVKTAASLSYFATESLRDYVTKWPENKKAYSLYNQKGKSLCKPLKQ